MSPASRPNRYRAASSARSSLVGGVMAIEISLRCELLGCGSITSLLAGPVDRGAAGPEWGDSPDPEVGGTPPGPGLACSPGMAPRMTSPLAAEEHLSQYRADEVVWHLATFTHSEYQPERYVSRVVSHGRTLAWAQRAGRCAMVPQFVRRKRTRARAVPR